MSKLVRLKLFGVKCQILHEYSQSQVSVRVETIDSGARFIVTDEILCQRGRDDYGEIAVIKAMIRDDPYGNFVPKGYVDARILNSNRVLRVRHEQIVSLTQ